MQMCSGIQRLAVLLLDFETGSRVNLIAQSDKDSVDDILTIFEKYIWIFKQITRLMLQYKVSITLMLQSKVSITYTKKSRSNNFKKS